MVNRTLRDARIRKFWSQERLAREAGVALGTVNQAETGRRHPSLITQQKIADALGEPREGLFPEDQREAS